MSSELSLKASMDTIRPVSQPRDTDGQITVVTQKERDVAADVRKDITVSGNDVPAQSRVVQEVSETDLNKAVGELSHHAQSISRDLEFTIDKDLDKTIITVYDAESEEIIRQIPSEEALSIARNMRRDDAALINVKA